MTRDAWASREPMTDCNALVLSRLAFFGTIPRPTPGRGKVRNMAQRDPRNLSRWLILALLVIVAGCAHFRKQESSLTLPNPLEIPLEEEEFAWNELVDTVDDYFPIAREERVRLIGNVMTEGRIQTKAVKELIVDLLAVAAARTDNKVDDQAVALIREKLL